MTEDNTPIGDVNKDAVAKDVHTDKATVAGEKAAAEFFGGIGVDLIEWPYNWQKPEAEKNMAVLDDRNVRIVRIEKVELDPKGHQLIEGSQQLIKEF